MKIAVAAELSSFRLMKMIEDYLVEAGHNVVNLGMQNEDQPLKFYETAPRVARAIQDGTVERGILTCGTGTGVCICANKFEGVYASAVESATVAELNYVINRSNVLCMGAWIVGEKVALDIVKRWLSAEIGAGFSEERRQMQAVGFAKIQELENENFK